MEILQKYWYVALGALVLLIFLGKRQSQAATLQQVGGVDQNTLTLAELAADSQNKQLDRQYGFASAFLNYNLQSRQVDQVIPLTNIQANAQAQALASQNQLAILSANLQDKQIQAQSDLQNRALSIQQGNKRREDWLGLISSGLGFAAAGLGF